MVCEYVKRQFQVTFSKRGMLNLLHRIKLSYTRPTYSLAKADPEKQEKFREELESIKKTSIAIIKKTNNRQSWQTNGGNREEKRK